MVIGKEYVWGHLGKTGGNTTHKMFGLVPQLVLRADPIHGNPWQWLKHETFTQRETRFNLDLTHKRKRILNIRRLPNFMLSSLHHRAKHERIPFSKRDLVYGTLKFLDYKFKDGACSNTGKILERTPDMVLQHMMGERVDYWFRLESLPADFIQIMQQFGNISDAQKKAIHELQAENVNAYDRSLKFWLTRREMIHLYDACPGWASVEKKVYGNLLYEIE